MWSTNLVHEVLLDWQSDIADSERALWSDLFVTSSLTQALHLAHVRFPLLAYNTPQSTSEFCMLQVNERSRND